MLTNVLSAWNFIISLAGLIGFAIAWYGFILSRHERRYNHSIARLRGFVLEVARVAEVKVCDPESVRTSHAPPFDVAVRDYMRREMDSDVRQVFAAPPPPMHPSGYEPLHLVPQVRNLTYWLMEDWRVHNGVVAGGGGVLLESKVRRASERRLREDLYSLHERSTLLLDLLGKQESAIGFTEALAFQLKHPRKARQLRQRSQEMLEGWRRREFELFDMVQRGSGEWLG